MPNFHFHTRRGGHLFGNPDGSDLPDFEAARAEALAAAREGIAARIRAGDVVDGQPFEIWDAAGRMLAIVPFRDALRFSVAGRSTEGGAPGPVGPAPQRRG